MVELKERASSVTDVEGCRGPDFDDDGKPRRTGTVWTASAHIITAVIGSGVLSLAWSTAQLGWIGGPAVLVLFSIITFYASSLLADCYRNGDPVTGRRNYIYMDAVSSNLSSTNVFFCGLCQYVILVGTSIGYTITASISAAAVKKSNCLHKRGHEADCSVEDSLYMVGFGVVQIVLSQLPNFHELWWLSIVAAIMSFSYSLIAVGLSLAKVISGETGTTSITGTVVGVDVSGAEKMWHAFQALGDIAFAYSYSMILIEIQDTLRSPPAENKTMKKASLIGVSTTTTFYMLCGCLGYAAFGNNAPGNILTGFGFFEPYWLIDFANVCIIVHLLGAYQVYCQPVYAKFEEWIASRYPNSKFVHHERPLINTGDFKFSINSFRLVWRTIFVILVTLMAILLPFFNDILGFLGSVSFWPLTVYFPFQMYISRKNIARSSPRWILMQTISVLSFIVTLVSAVGSIEGVVEALQHYTPFKSKS